jgi:hypothetical protein
VTAVCPSSTAARSSSVSGNLEFPAVKRDGPAAVIDTEARWENARRLLHDDTAEHEDRVAGLLVLLYAQWPAAISRLTLAHVQTSGGTVRLRLAANRSCCPNHPPGSSSNWPPEDGVMPLQLATDLPPRSSPACSASTSASPSPGSAPAAATGPPTPPKSAAGQSDEAGIQTVGISDVARDPQRRRREAVELVGNLVIIQGLCARAGVPSSDVRGNITSHRARSTIASQLYNAKEPMTLFELQAWLGHRTPTTTQHYAKISPNTLSKAYTQAGYFARNVRTTEVLLDRDAITSGAAATGQPWQHLGHGWCSYSFFEQCQHRMACAPLRLLHPERLQQGPAAGGQRQPAAHARQHHRQLLFLGPTDKIADLAAVAGIVAGQPGVQVALPSRRNREVAGVAPVEQFDRRPLPVGSVRAAQAGTQSPQETPHRVGVEQLLLPGDRHTRSSYARGVSSVAKLVHVARHERW